MSSLLQSVSSDEQLTTAIAAGDDDAFEELYRRYSGPLAAYGSRVLRDRSRGEDVAQTALMRAYDAVRRGTEPLRVKPWLYKIALNTALELREKNGDVLEGGSDEIADASGDFREARADILAGVERLPDRQRKVFVLREIHGLPVGEVASRLELTSQQVEQALFAARNRLAEALVFGERIDCHTIRTLDRSRLTHYERRAVKSHVRACPTCRRNAPFGFSSLAFWLRDAWAWLTGGLGASAAKIGAVTVAAGLVGGTPVVASQVAARLGHAPTKAMHVALNDFQPLELARRLSPAVAEALPLPVVAAAAPGPAIVPSPEPPAEAASSDPEQLPAEPDRVESATTEDVQPAPADEVPADPSADPPADPPADPAPDPAPDPSPDPAADPPPADTPPPDVLPVDPLPPANAAPDPAATPAP